MINLTWGLHNMKKNDFKQWWGLASTDMCICEPDQPLSNQMSSDILLISTSEPNCCDFPGRFEQIQTMQFVFSFTVHTAPAPHFGYPKKLPTIFSTL